VDQGDEHPFRGADPEVELAAVVVQYTQDASGGAGQIGLHEGCPGTTRRRSRKLAEPIGPTDLSEHPARVLVALQPIALHARQSRPALAGDTGRRPHRPARLTRASRAGPTGA